MIIAIVDADFISRRRHRFPNLSCMKLSSYFKNKGHEVFLKNSWNNIGEDADKTFVAKVFTNTEFPKEILGREDIVVGGTGFFFDKADPLPYEIEHSMPDYYLYSGEAFGRFYKDYSIGFLTRGCFRHCKFCVNQNSNRSMPWSPLEEFYDDSRRKLCFLDDNFLACREWRKILDKVINTGKPFRFHQGLDERILDEEKCKVLFSAKYDSDITFAFDDIKDSAIIQEKMNLIRKYTDTNAIRFYVLCGFKGTGSEDVMEMLERVKIIGNNGMLPYIMRYASPDKAPWKESEWKGIYINVARWVNQPALFKKMTFSDYCEAVQKTIKTGKICSAMRAFNYFEERFPEESRKYFRSIMFKK